MSENRIGRESIKPQLVDVAWGRVPKDLVKTLPDHVACMIDEDPIPNEPVDNALFLDGRIVGIVEAKREGLGTQVLRDTYHWVYGVPSAGNANFAWMRHFIRPVTSELGGRSYL